MKRNRFGYYIREGVGSIFTHGFMSFASVCIITACLIIMGCFVLLAVNVNEIIGELEKDNMILAYIREDLSEAEARSLEPSLRAIPNVTAVLFVSREEAFDRYISKYTDKSRFKDIDASVLKHRYHIYIDDVAKTEDTANALSATYGVENLTVNLEIARGFVKVRNIVSVVSVIIVAILLLVSLFIMSNTIKLTTFERREEIAIMRMVGATNAFIRWPFVFEGFLLGISGAVIAFGALWALYMALSESFVNLELGFISLLPFERAALPMLIAFGLIGFGVGTCGSVMAIKKYLKV